jgi:hypothetical protein
MDALVLTALDEVFDIYGQHDDQEKIRKKVSIDYSTYGKLTTISEQYGISVQELLLHIYMLYVNEYKVNGRCNN